MHIEDFDTLRLCVQHWAPMLEDPARRSILEDALRPILTPAVLAELPPSMQLADNTAEARGQWVTNLATEAEVFVVQERPLLTPMGLLILSVPPVSGPKVEIHLGYLLGEPVWGKGFATELLQGLIEAIPTGAELSLIGGVSTQNPASARVLEKAGFQKDKTLSSADTDMFVLER